MEKQNSETQIIPIDPELVRMANLFLEKLEQLTKEERSLYVDIMKLYTYPRYIIEAGASVLNLKHE